MKKPKIKSESTGVYKAENLELNATYKLEHLDGKTPNIEKLTIFNVYVEMDSQETCDRMKQLCLDNGLQIWGFMFKIWKRITMNNSFGFSYKLQEFVIHGDVIKNKIPVTEQQFINLLKEYKDGI